MQNIRVDEALGRGTIVATANAVSESGSMLATLTTTPLTAQRLMVWHSAFSNPRGRKTTRDNRKNSGSKECSRYFAVG